ncbi:MAG: hypothetical protein LBK57_03780 [Clostridiales Family XIII bacterium]|nr:hypothetical protein [Clostridiales Family XIII bacterium]
MKNRLIDLNNHLFAEIERLGDEDLKGDELTKEIERARAITGVASQIIGTGTLALRAATAMSNSIDADFRAPSMLLEEPKCENTQKK